MFKKLRDNKKILASLMLFGVMALAICALAENAAYAGNTGGEAMPWENGK